MKIQLKGLSGGKDRRGFASFSARYLFTDATLDEALTGSLPTSITSLPEVGRQFTEWDVDNNGFIIDVNFEGVIDEPTEDDDVFIITPEWREEPIEAFPNRKALEEKYGAYDEDGRLKFPETLAGGTTSSGSGLGSNAGTEKKNPLYGTTTYPTLRVVAQQSFCRKKVPASIYRDIGTVVKTLPAGFENPPKGPWIVDVPRLRKRGNVWEIVRTWKDVDRLEHLEALYLLLQK